MVADAVSSRTQTDRHLALERMRTIGAHITTTESTILSLVGDASHQNFKEIQVAQHKHLRITFQMHFVLKMLLGAKMTI